jgi:hypothetical protein
LAAGPPLFEGAAWLAVALITPSGDAGHRWTRGGVGRRWLSHVPRDRPKNTLEVGKRGSGAIVRGPLRRLSTTTTALSGVRTSSHRSCP